MPSLESLFKDIREELRERESIRERIQEEMRTMTSLSKRAILLIHQKKIDQAEELIKKAKKIMAQLHDSSAKYPEIIYSNLFHSAQQEYSEANIILNLIRESRFVTPREINVSANDYVLGLADVIGEYRRLAIDALREGSVEQGEEILRRMDEIFSELMAMGETYTFVHGLRRKCDIARRIIEITRGDVTQEVRRSSLEGLLRNLQRLLESKKPADE